MGMRYAEIRVSSGSVEDVLPKGTEPQAQHALQAGKQGSVVDSVNKLAETGYKLVDGSIPTGAVSPSGANYILFMYRED